MTNLYDLSIGTYKRVLESTINVMEKGLVYFDEQGIDLTDVVDMRLAPDMAAFSSQINFIRHHSLGAVKGILDGSFSTPSDMPELDFKGLINVLSDTLDELNLIDASAIAATKGKAMYFKVGDFEIPFTSENFVLTFSMPNLYFHATTVYDMLRIKGAPLRKMDFLGIMKTGLTES
ncbi:MAG: DUF1993 domain-containing protein [Oleispira sp.]|nr:DUF1993 domain-containing protein [Oleispira sp.]